MIMETLIIIIIISLIMGVYVRYSWKEYIFAPYRYNALLNLILGSLGLLLCIYLIVVLIVKFYI